jgi:hypothetical protein
MAVSGEARGAFGRSLSEAIDGPRQLVGIHEKDVRRDLCRAARLSLRASRLQASHVLCLGTLLS